MFVFPNLKEFGVWLQQQANKEEESAKTSPKLRDQYHHRSRKSAYTNLADMIKTGEITLRSEQ